MRRIVTWLLVIAVVVGIGYTAYVGYEGSRQMVSVDERAVATAARPTCCSAGSTRRSTTTSPTTPP